MVNFSLQKTPFFVTSCADGQLSSKQEQNALVSMNSTSGAMATSPAPLQRSASISFVSTSTPGYNATSKFSRTQHSYSMNVRAGM